jgi:predicted TIM-barrel fold metal-dependent hydrolase
MLVFSMLLAAAALRRTTSRFPKCKLIIYHCGIRVLANLSWAVHILAPTEIPAHLLIQLQL